jgi:hypothetical protein
MHSHRGSFCERLYGAMQGDSGTSYFRLYTSYVNDGVHLVGPAQCYAAINNRRAAACCGSTIVGGLIGCARTCLAPTLKESQQAADLLQRGNHVAVGGNQVVAQIPNLVE